MRKTFCLFLTAVTLAFSAAAADHGTFEKDRTGEETGFGKKDYKKVENNIQIGAGASWTDNDSGRTGIANSIGYGIDIRLSGRFSLMPMVDWRITSESIIRQGWVGADFNDFSFLDFSVSARWHFDTGGIPVAVGIAPYLSYALDKDQYYIDYDPRHPLGGKAKLKAFDFGLMPSVSCDVWKFLSLGAKANLSLTDTSVRYDFYPNIAPRHIISAEIFARVRF